MGDQEETGQQASAESTSTAPEPVAEPAPEPEEETKGSAKTDGPIAQPDNKYHG